MKTYKWFALVVLAGLVGCAHQTPGKESGYNDRIDWEKVAKVNKAAREKGVQVQWIAYPQKQNDEH